jgi:glycosyltransferase involved in cell wall biosynthesis
MSNKNISVVLPIYNQEDIIFDILHGVLDNKSDNVKEIIVILDGCIDNTESIVKAILKTCNIKVKIIHTPDVNEVIASNIGYKSADCDFILAVQDDVRIRDKFYDERLMKPFKIVDNLMIVSGRNADDLKIEDGIIKTFNTSGADTNAARNVFAIRDVINRGPILIDHKKLKELNYLDETFAPLGQDDTDLSLRGNQIGYCVGSYVIDFESPLHWGTTRKNFKSACIKDFAERRNIQILINRYRDLISAPKHSRDIIIE